MDSDSFGSRAKTATSDTPKVLVAEDEKVLRLMMAKLLQVSGYKVYTCGDGLQALELVGKKSFDLVVTDMMMPGANGMEVLRATRRSQPRAKVIMVTGTPTSETLLAARREGVYAYLRKPFQLKHFLSVLKDAIEHSKLSCRHQYRRDLEVGSRNVERGI